MNIDLTRIKRDIAVLIVNKIHDGKMSQKKAAEFLGCAQPRMSELKNMKLDLFSVDALLVMAMKFGHSVNILNFDSTVTIKVK